MKPTPTGVFFYIPARFEVSQIPGLCGLADEVHWLLWRIISLWNYRRHEHDSRDFYACIGVRSMEQFIHPSQVSRVKNELLAAGVIECDDKYMPAKFDPAGTGKSLGYRIAAAFTIGGLRKVECTKGSLARKMRQHRVTSSVNHFYSDRLLTYLRDKFDELNIDPIKAANIIAGLPEQDNDTDGGMWRKACAGMTVDTIASGAGDLTVCPYGRVHTPATRLITEARPALSVNHSPLTSIDIRNSQLIFLLLSILASENCSTSGVAFGRLVGWGGSHFAGMVESGEFYDGLMVVVGAVDRRDFKRQFFRDVLFGDDRRAYTQTPLRRAFAAAYPDEDKYIRAAKQGDYRNLARSMQRAESSLVIGGVCERLRTEIPAAPVITIHDAVLTTTPFVSAVVAVMQEEFARLGVHPTLKIEALGAA